ncbi:MadR family response regulator transcription factor [Candidatus Mycolicibacterium alkanivorans]|uniref:MadR family response regulator transcription factor n=1 Tax=Candidatus Mycolicibacterium alkanivorans TaxID=2954114 RepID=UPI0027E0ABD9|nr:response regulator transcription factor [Candidatus Mycolicibacterium alkanivorans]
MISASYEDGAPTRIVLVDDHAVVRAGLRSILEREPDLSVVGEAASAGEALAVVDETRPDIVVLDLKLSTGSDTEGLEVCEKLTTRYPEVGVLVLTSIIDDAVVVEAIHRGARGYVIKDVDTTALIESVRAAARSDGVLDPRSAGAVMRSMRSKVSEPALTEREQRVLDLMAQGLTNGQIATQLFVSVATVKFHVRNILTKLHASSRAEAAYLASKRGLI